MDRNLFHVQDPDRSMFVLAKNYEEALEKWRARIRLENVEDQCEEPYEEPIFPQGVSYLADMADIIE